MWLELEASYMSRALELAARGQGYVEPNPLVGCLIVRDGEVVGEGFHQRFGGHHAEVEALAAAGASARGATMYVTLEPCCHQGQTPPCTKAILQAGIARVVAAMEDPFPKVAGGGLAELRGGGVETAVGLLADEAATLNAPYLELLSTGRPWVIAKWAMTLDGKLASHAGDSRWISNEHSRRVVHELRGRMDAIVVGSGTAAIDDPLLTARPPGARVATRVVIDSKATLRADSQLVKTAREVPVLVAVSSDAPAADQRRLRDAGCEVLLREEATHAERLAWLLDELGRRRMTNLLVEGGGRLLGALFDAQAIDEVHVFIAQRLLGGASAPSPIGGVGIASLKSALPLENPTAKLLDGDIYVQGRMPRS